MDLADLDNNSIAPTESVLLEAKVKDNATGVKDEVRCIIAGFDPHQATDPMPWMAYQDSRGTFYPKIGDRAVLAFPDEGPPVIAWWKPRAEKPDAAAVVIPNPPSAKAYKAAGQAITNATITALTFDSEFFDNAAIHSTVTNATRLTAPEAGVYVITGNVVWPSSGTGERFLAVRLNGSGSGYLAADRRIPTTNAEQQVTVQHKLAAADYVELMVFQSSGGSLTTETVGAFYLAPQAFGMTRISAG